MARSKPQNAPSQLLNEEENQLVFTALGQQCVSLSTAVVQLYLAQNNKWSIHARGAACFVKDYNLRSFFIRIVDLQTGNVEWEEELYTEFKCKAARDFFITFEAKECQAGLNFASEEEAAEFKWEIDKKTQKNFRRQERRTRREVRNNTSSGPGRSNVTHAARQTGRTTTSSGPRSPTTKTQVAEDGKRSMKGGRKKKLTKADISDPVNFQHLHHVGYDSSKGLDDLDSDMKQLFQQVGITSNEQLDDATMEFIYDFVDQHGGREQLRKELAKEEEVKKPPARPPKSVNDSIRSQKPIKTDQSKRRPRPPNFSPPPLPQSPPNSHPASSPRKQGDTETLPPPSPTVNTPEPPKHDVDVPLPPPPPIDQAPPPPPPPPPPVPPPPPSAPPPPPSAPPSPPSAPPPPPAAPPPPPAPTAAPPTGPPPVKQSPTTPGGGGSRGDLLQSIRMGMTLRHVSQEDKTESKSTGVVTSGGIVGSLAHALATRSKRIQGSDESSSDDSQDDDDEEWED